MLVRKIFFISSLLFVFSMYSSCTPHELKKEYFISQPRDSRLFGVWVRLHRETNEETEYIDEYFPTGEIIRHKYPKNTLNYLEYYYTLGDNLHVLNTGDGFKINSSVLDLKYEISEDGKYMYINYPNDKAKKEQKVWKRK